MTRKKKYLYDQAVTHTFSDWLVPYAFGVGVPDLDEVYLGGFPDLSSFLVRREGTFTLNLRQFRYLTSHRLTRFGRLLRREVKNKSVLDLGSGIPVRSLIPRLLSQAFGALDYLGVDQRSVRILKKLSAFEKLGVFKASYTQSDLLKFLKTYSRSHPLFVFAIGLEPYRNSVASVNYLKAVREELSKKLRPGDTLFVGAGTPDLELSPRKFVRLYSDSYQEMFKRI